MTDADLRKVLDILAASQETTFDLLIHGYGGEGEAVIAAVDRGLIVGRVATLANPDIAVVYLHITDAGRVWLEKASLG